MQNSEKTEVNTDALARAAFALKDNGLGQKTLYKMIKDLPPEKCTEVLKHLTVKEMLAFAELRLGDEEMDQVTQANVLQAVILRKKEKEQEELLDIYGNLQNPFILSLLDRKGLLEIANDQTFPDKNRIEALDTIGFATLTEGELCGLFGILPGQSYDKTISGYEMRKDLDFLKALIERLDPDLPQHEKFVFKLSETTLSLNGYNKVTQVLIPFLAKLGHLAEEMFDRILAAENDEMVREILDHADISYLQERALAKDTPVDIVEGIVCEIVDRVDLVNDSPIDTANGTAETLNKVLVQVLKQAPKDTLSIDLVKDALGALGEDEIERFFNILEVAESAKQWRVRMVAVGNLDLNILNTDKDSLNRLKKISTGDRSKKVRDRAFEVRELLLPKK